MSDSPVREADTAAEDPLLAALRHLPARAMDGSAEARLQREARAAYVRGFAGSARGSAVAGVFGRVAMPVFLAGVVGLYMTWAFAAATALVH